MTPEEKRQQRNKWARDYYIREQARRSEDENAARRQYYRDLHARRLKDMTPEQYDAYLVRRRASAKKWRATNLEQARAVARTRYQQQKKVGLSPREIAQRWQRAADKFRVFRMKQEQK